MTEETKNLRYWDQFSDIDPKYTKAITGKPYKGTSPNPHYVIRCLTEMFGPVGEGFGWDVEAEGFEHIGEEVLHWCRIRFWHGTGKGFSAYGQTKALMKTRNGFMSDEDAPKKSLTDAITKAAAQVGVASNIFLGRWDDSKYVAEVNAEYRAKEGGDKQPAPKPEAPKAQEQAKPDPRKLADKMINAMKGAEHYGQWQAITNDPSFQADLAFVEKEAPPMANEVRKAISDAKLRVDPAGQAA